MIEFLIGGAIIGLIIGILLSLDDDIILGIILGLFFGAIAGGVIYLIITFWALIVAGIVLIIFFCILMALCSNPSPSQQFSPAKKPSPSVEPEKPLKMIPSDIITEYHAPTVEPTFKCKDPKCNRTFKSNEAMNRHYNSVHQSKIDKDKNRPEKVKTADKVLKINQKDSDAWFNKGNKFFDMGASKCFDEAYRLDPRYTDMLEIKKKILQDKSKNKVMHEYEGKNEYAKQKLVEELNELERTNNISKSNKKQLYEMLRNINLYAPDVELKIYELEKRIFKVKYESNRFNILRERIDDISEKSSSMLDSQLFFSNLKKLVDECIYNSDETSIGNIKSLIDEIETFCNKFRNVSSLVHESTVVYSENFEKRIELLQKKLNKIKKILTTENGIPNVDKIRDIIESLDKIEDHVQFEMNVKKEIAETYSKINGLERRYHIDIKFLKEIIEEKYDKYIIYFIRKIIDDAEENLGKIMKLDLPKSTKERDIKDVFLYKTYKARTDNDFTEYTAQLVESIHSSLKGEQIKEKTKFKLTNFKQQNYDEYIFVVLDYENLGSEFKFMIILPKIFTKDDLSYCISDVFLDEPEQLKDEILEVICNKIKNYKSVN